MKHLILLISVIGISTNSLVAEVTSEEREQMIQALREAMAASWAEVQPSEHHAKMISAVREALAGRESGMEGGTTVATQLSGTKQRRLAALLQDYQAGTVTPTEYHAQRAQIISEP